MEKQFKEVDYQIITIGIRKWKRFSSLLRKQSISPDRLWMYTICDMTLASNQFPFILGYIDVLLSFHEKRTVLIHWHYRETH